MSKKPRGKPQLLERPVRRPNQKPKKSVILDDLRDCQESTCHNVIAVSPGYSGEVYCSIHSHLREKT